MYCLFNKVYAKLDLYTYKPNVCDMYSDSFGQGQNFLKMGSKKNKQLAIS